MKSYYYRRGFFKAMDHIIKKINSLDTEHMSKQEIRSYIIKEAMIPPY